MKPKYYTRLTQYDAFIGFSRKHDSVLKKLRGFSLNCMQLLCWSATNKTQYAIITVNWQQYALLVNGSGPGVMAVPCWSATNKIRTAFVYWRPPLAKPWQVQMQQTTKPFPRQKNWKCEKTTN
jgi:hypothetical protein